MVGIISLTLSVFYFNKPKETQPGLSPKRLETVRYRLKVLNIILLFALFLSACGPTGSPAPVQTVEETTAGPAINAVPTATLAPVAAPPPPQLYELYPDADPDEVSTYAAIAACVPDPNLTSKLGGIYNLHPCLDEDFMAVSSVLSVVTLASVYSLSSAEVAAGTFTIAGVVTTIVAGVETVVAVIVASPVTVPAAIIAVTGLTLYAFISSPPSITDPRLADWVAGVYPSKVAMMANGQFALGGGTAVFTEDMTRMSEVDVDAFVERWDLTLRFTSGPTAVIIEDHPVHAANAYLALSALGFKVLGVYPSCSSFMGSSVMGLISGGMFINLYLIDEQLLGGENGSACAVSIRSISPASFILHYSSLGRRDIFGNQIRATNQLNGATGVTDAVQKKQSMFRFIEYILENADKIVPPG